LFLGSYTQLTAEYILYLLLPQENELQSCVSKYEALHSFLFPPFWLYSSLFAGLFFHYIFPPLSEYEIIPISLCHILPMTSLNHEEEKQPFSSHLLPAWCGWVYSKINILSFLLHSNANQHSKAMPRQLCVLCWL